MIHVNPFIISLVFLVFILITAAVSFFCGFECGRVSGSAKK